MKIIYAAIVVSLIAIIYSPTFLLQPDIPSLLSAPRLLVVSVVLCPVLIAILYMLKRSITLKDE